MVRALDRIASVFSSPAMQAMRRDEDECERATGWIMDARDWVLNYSGIFLYRRQKYFWSGIMRVQTVLLLVIDVWYTYYVLVQMLQNEPGRATSFS